MYIFRIEKSKVLQKYELIGKFKTMLTINNNMHYLIVKFLQNFFYSMSYNNSTVWIINKLKNDGNIQNY